MYRLIVVYNYERFLKAEYADLGEAKLAYEATKDRYARQGYTGKVLRDGEEILIEEPTEVKGDTEWVYTVTRIPFEGSTGDPTTGEVTYTPTGMTDTIEIHLELQSKGEINPGIPMPENPIKAHFGK